MTARSCRVGEVRQDDRTKVITAASGVAFPCEEGCSRQQDFVSALELTDLGLQRLDRRGVRRGDARRAPLRDGLDRAVTSLGPAASDPGPRGASVRLDHLVGHAVPLIAC